MNRRDFLKSMLGIGVAVVAAPLLAFTKPKANSKPDGSTIHGDHGFGVGDTIRITNSTNHDGLYLVSGITPDGYEISPEAKAAIKAGGWDAKKPHDYWNQGRRW